MKKLLIAIGLALCVSVNAQTNTIPDVTTNKWFQFVGAVSEARQITFVAYPGYAPDLTIDGESKPWGAGVAFLYPLMQVGDVVGTYVGARLDYLGDEFWAPSVTLGVQAKVLLFGH